ncbi:putative metallopeptidase domain protein [Vibrio phage 1.238.A._10N.261.52.F10]|uniref:Putative metallopeptidase domain protein n=2 Tax=Pariacacavirus TaxID=2948856 RepID=A0A2I7RUI1_9CAUD|nr:HNH endonuclease [Vibrio phage 1.238.A._10N.261.52.F10]YP_010093505.1 HNH endonuclease [Vibrio phage 1.245.O._10N.261.54.C7]AUR97308.1 putative metallopeptidase domain protein [Vibrio phage 1.238.A._10N.261.52.F10]AUR97402.1 putative metallopeptidase domain protein [Vibrio phage 1.238.B._10N.261.52.F10]AUR97975.1 putative metallopeptidase domain protein [Vibrio phage 1.245.O._10N.261.54.C7]
MTDVNTLISQTKVKVMMSPKTGFISALMLALEQSADESVPTAQTNGLSIKYNPTWFSSLDLPRRVFLMLHETWHVAYDHCVPLDKQYDPKTMNDAQDYYINNQLIKEGFTFVEGGLKDTKYGGWTVMQIYDDLIKSGKQNQSNSMGSDIKPAEGTPEEQKETQTKIQEAIVKAATQAKMAGQGDSIPDEINRFVEEVLNPKLKWHQVLEHYMHERVKDEYSWSRRNRRYPDVYLPSLWSEGMGEIRCYRDASGSISHRELCLETAEILYIKETVNPSLMTITDFSHYLGEPREFERADEITTCDIPANAQGGTDLAPVWRDLKANEETEVAVIFTDGYVSVPPLDELSCDVVFVIVNNKEWTHPDCTVIHMEIKHE